MGKLARLCFFSVFVSILGIFSHCVFSDDRKVYIVYMGSLPESNYSPLAHHQSILEEVLEDSSLSDSLVQSYRRSFNGFAAKLTERERQKLASMEGIVSVFPSTKYKLHTTRSWDFMGLKENVKRIPKVESDVIVGMIDTGIWPEAESFNDKGFGPPSRKWKGVCKGGNNFTCNNKIIGARVYLPTEERFWKYHSARDDEGHGTHTASIAAGNQINNASLYGLAQGNTRGAVPSARIAVYKVCGGKGPGDCDGTDILGAFDDAISDGVDIISVSLGTSAVAIEDYTTSVIAIGGYHAMKKGILTSHAAGNNGPNLFNTGSIAPWVLSVAAGTTDRNIIEKVILGDNTTLFGKALNYFDMKGKKYPLLDGGCSMLGSCDDADCDRLLPEEHLGNKSVEGKIVFYDGYSWGQELEGKAAGMILEECEGIDISDSFRLPTSKLNFSNGEKVKTYIRNTKSPFATITKAEALKDHSAPSVPSFSSRGPNFLTPDILKPDVTAPGVDILAAWPSKESLSGDDDDGRFVKYNILSGTSMACPHATGAAAYVKTFHPNWSPSMIKSALMTTAFPMNATTNSEAEFAYGAGHINPVRAVSPGLVYETVERDYLDMLCSIGYTEKKIRVISGDNSSSCPLHFSVSPRDLNYPSMTSYNVTESNFTRTVTNVGLANSTYTATISSPSNVKVSVKPNVLLFKTLYEKQRFVVTVSAKAVKDHPISSASLTWSDGFHSVRSPIVVYLQDKE